MIFLGSTHARAALLAVALPFFAACSAVGTNGIALGEVAPVQPPANEVDLRTVVPKVPVIVMPDASIIRGGEMHAQETLRTVSTTAPCGSRSALTVGEDRQFSIDASGETTTTFAEVGSGHRLSHDARPDGSGEFFNTWSQGEVSVRVNRGGSSTFLHTTSTGTTSVTAHPGGAAELYRREPEQFFTVFARADGSGEFYFESGGQITTALADGKGNWQVSTHAPGRRIELIVHRDGSGMYNERGVQPKRIAFEPGEVGVPSPMFRIEGMFPRLQQLAFNPACPEAVFEPRLLFDFGSAVLRSEAGTVLDDFVASVNDADLKLEVVGHTDSLGSDTANLDLSTRRAEAVAEALRARGLKNIRSLGLGESQPIAPNEHDDGSDNPEGRSSNRRVEISVRGSDQ